MRPNARRDPRCRLGLAALLAILAPPSQLLAQPGPPPVPPPDENAHPDDYPQPENYPPPDYYPPPGYYPTPGYYPPPDYYPPPGYYPPPAPPLQTGEPQVGDAPALAPPTAAPALPYALGATLSSGIESTGNSTSVVTSPLLEGAYAVRPSVLLALSLGFGWLVDNQGLGESTFRAGNPQLSGTYRASRGRWRFHAGLGLTAPLAHVPLSPDGRLYAFVYNRTLAMWGMWDQWLWLPDRMAVPAAFRASYTLESGPVLVVEHADAMVFGVRGNASGAAFVGQLAFEAQLPVGPMITLVPRLQTVLLPKVSIDRWQNAASLRAVVKTKAGRFFAGVLVNLDEPIAAQGGIERWGFHLGKEVDL